MKNFEFKETIRVFDHPFNEDRKRDVQSGKVIGSKYFPHQGHKHPKFSISDTERWRTLSPGDCSNGD